MRRPPRPILDRFLEKISPEPMSGCWLWDGAWCQGYSQMMIGSKKLRTAKIEYGHRISYELFKGPIPEGYHVDHECKLTCCVNPDHLQLLTPTEHQRVTLERLPVHPLTAKSQTKTHCPEGHELTGRNLIVGVTPRGTFRTCRTCRVRKQQDRRAAERTANPAPPKPPRTHCIHGHPWVPENLYRCSQGYWHCTTCKLIGNKRRWAEEKAQRAQKGATNVSV